jgi:putative ABC transport system ATP-binding protein
VIFDNGWKTGDLRALRRERIGFVFQAPYLILFLDATDNVALVPMLAGVSNTEARHRAGNAHRTRRATPRAGTHRRRADRAARQRTRAHRGRLTQKFRTASIVVTCDEKIIPTFKRIYPIRDGKTYEEAGEGREIA